MNDFVFSNNEYFRNPVSIASFFFCSAIRTCEICFWMTETENWCLANRKYEYWLTECKMRHYYHLKEDLCMRKEFSFISLEQLQQWNVNGHRKPFRWIRIRANTANISALSLCSMLHVPWSRSFCTFKNNYYILSWNIKSWREFFMSKL